MSEIKYSRNYRDLCKNYGVESGFQFEFICERCSDTWRSSFRPYRSGQISGWFYRIGAMFGGMIRQAGLAADGLARARWSDARDNAFNEAKLELEKYFKRCGKCNRHVCASCWSVDKDSCLSCSPNTKTESTQNQTKAGEKEPTTKEAAQEELTCPKCKSKTLGAKFCTSCGHQFNCSKCNGKILPGTKFCGECGQSVSD